MGGAYAVKLGYNGNSDTGNVFTNNTIQNGTTLVYLGVNAGSNTFSLNNLTGSVWVNDLNGTNYYNDSTSGNIYYFANGTASWQVYDIIDTTGDNWADSGTDRPFNSSFTEWTGSGEDWYPWTALKTLQINATITYPVGYSKTGIAYLISGINGTCRIQVDTQVNDTGTAGVARNITCNRYNWFSGALIDSNFSTSVNTSFMFYPNTTDYYAFNCSAEIDGTTRHTQTEVVQFIGAEFCTSGDVAGQVQTSEYVFVSIILFALCIGYVGVFVLKEQFGMPLIFISLMSLIVAISYISREFFGNNEAFDRMYGMFVYLLYIMLTVVGLLILKTAYDFATKPKL